MPDSIPLKCCTACKQSFPATTEFFYSSKQVRCGLQARCKSCQDIAHRKWLANNRYRVNESMREWHKRNPTKQSEYEKKRNKNDKYRKRKQDWRHSHKTQISKSAHKYYLRNRDTILARNKNWHDTHLADFRIYIQKRRYKERKGNFTTQDWQICLEYWDHKCAICGCRVGFWTTLAIDHWKPIFKGGEHVATNIVPLCHAKLGTPNGKPHCNNSKGTNDAYEWLVLKFGKRFANKKIKEIQAYFDFLTSQH